MKYFIHIIFSLALNACEEKIESSKFPEAEAQNFDIEKLTNAYIKMAKVPQALSLVVSRNGTIVAEEFYNGGKPNPDEVLHVMSVTKSITSTLVGIAIDKGYIQGVDQVVSDFYDDITNPELGNVTIAQLLTMSAGHDWKEINDGSEFSDWINSSNQMDYIIDKEIVQAPGTLFDYSDGSAHLVSGILEKATGMNTSVFADINFFEPMGIGSREWYVDKQGISLGGVGLIIGPYDMIKIGELYLNDGFYNNQQIVSSLWVQQAISPKISPEGYIQYLQDYGYYWWIGERNGINFILALGYGGQFILICKEKNLVISATCDYRVNNSQAGSNWSAIFNILTEDMLLSAK